jgi:MFS family permease
VNDHVSVKGIGMRGLRHNREWRLLWLGQAVSLTGDSMFDITILLWVATVIAKGEPWAPAAGSGVLIAAAVPVLAVGPAAGVFVDRWDRRHTMMAADAFRAVLIAATLAVPALGDAAGRGAELAAVYLVVALESAAGQFFNPARLATLGRVVTSPGQRAQAAGLLQATGSLAVIIGEPLAAALLFTAGARWALVIDAASFAGSFLAVRAMKVAQAPEGVARDGFRRELAAGARFFATSRILVALCGGVMVATLGTGALNALMVFFVTGHLHTAARWLGVLSGAFGAGAVLGALAGGWAAARAGPARVFCAGLVAGGVLLAVFSQTGAFAVAAVLAASVGLMFGALNAAAPPLFLAVIPQHLIGRVMAIFNPLQQGANITSMALAGVLATAGLPVSAIFGASAVAIVAAGCATIVPLRGAAHTSQVSLLLVWVYARPQRFIRAAAVGSAATCLGSVGVRA